MGKVKDYYHHRQKEVDLNMQEYYIDLWKQDSTKTKSNNITNYFNKKGDK